jgi:hypothetical protein
MRFVAWLKSGTPLAIFLKSVGTASALISLFLGVVQVKNVVVKWRAVQTAARELLAAADFKLSTRDYPQAWLLISQAVDSFPSSAPAKAKQLTVAMAWLRDITHTSEANDPTFSAVADKLTPVLLRAASRTEGREKADVLAHLGWLTFLKWRDGARGLSVAQPYQQALAIDSSNLYAHAMLGHWLLYPGGGRGTLSDAQAHFAAALTSAKTPAERQFIRTWQAAALINRNEEFAPEPIRLAAAMAAEGDTLSPGDRSKILWLAYTLPGWPGLAHLTDSVGVAQQQAAFPWLTHGLDAERQPLYRAVVARLTELSGDTAGAVLRYQAILKESPALPAAGRAYLAGAVKRQPSSSRP